MLSTWTPVKYVNLSKQLALEQYDEGHLFVWGLSIDNQIRARQYQKMNEDWKAGDWLLCSVGGRTRKRPSNPTQKFVSTSRSNS